MNTMFLLEETINGENPASLDIESAPKVKPQNNKMISWQQ